MSPVGATPAPADGNGKTYAATDGKPSGAGLGVRNSNIGLAGNFGTVFFGHWDTPYKQSTDNLDPWWNTGVGAYDSLIGNPGHGVIDPPYGDAGRANSSDDASFNRRQGQSIQYWSPSFSGFSAKLG